MANLPFLYLVFFSLPLCSVPTLAAAAAAAATSRPKALLATISFDPSTSLFSFSLDNKQDLLLDLAASNLWIDCIRPSSPFNLNSPTFKPVRCNSAICNKAVVCNSLACSASVPCTTECPDTPSPICYNNTCSPFISNSAISTTTLGTLWTDTFHVTPTDGQNPGASTIQVPKLAFACTTAGLLDNSSAPVGAVGGGGLSRALLALPTQLASKFSLKRKFTYCLPGYSTGRGVLVFGHTPIYFQLGMEFSNYFSYTPLVRNPKEPDSYFLGVKSISVNGAKLPINPALFKLNQGSLNNGGMTLSTTKRYTLLEPSIYKALAHAFKAGANARGIKSVAPVSPFDTCFNESTAGYTRLGYNVPDITFTLQGSGRVTWTFFGVNSVVSLKDNTVICLAFQRRGQYETKSIILGSFQQHDALLEFDLATSRLGFLPSLVGLRSTCSNFNFTS